MFSLGGLGLRPVQRSCLFMFLHCWIFLVKGLMLNQLSLASPVLLLPTPLYVVHCSDNQCGFESVASTCHECECLLFWHKPVGRFTVAIDVS